MIQLIMILAQLLFIMNVVNQGGKRERERKWGGRQLLVRENPTHSLTLVMYAVYACVYIQLAASYKL